MLCKLSLCCLYSSYMICVLTAAQKRARNMVACTGALLSYLILVT